MSWSLEYIGSHVEKIKTWNPKESGLDEEFFYIDLSSVDNEKKVIDLAQVQKVLPLASPSRARQLVKKSDILVSTVRPNLNGVASVPDKLNDATASTGYCVLRPNKETLNSNYLFYWVQSNLFVNDMVSKATGANYPAVSDKIIKQSKIPLPHLAEQQKIAAILDAADSLRQKDQQLIDQYNALGRSLFLYMFGDPVVNPKKWSITAFGNSLIDIVGGKSVGGEQRQIKDNEKAVLKISAVTTGAFNSLEYKVVESCELPEILVHPQKGNLLFSRANTRELVGATCIVDKDYEYLFLPDKIWRLDLKLDMASNWYLRFLLTHEGFRENLRKVATGTSGSMLNISKAKLKQLKIPLPPVTLQNQFAERIQSIEAQKQQAQASLQKSEALFNSLLQRAFKGELTA